MAEIYTYSNAAIRNKLYWQGNAIDADGEVTVTVFDITENPLANPVINPNLAIGTFVANKTETDIGSYEVYLPYDYTVFQRKLRLFWSWEYNGSPFNSNTFCDVVVPYAQIEEVAEDLNLGSDFNDPNHKSYHELRMAEKYARKMVEYYTGQKFFLFDDTFTVMGNDSDTLPLPRKLDTLHKLHQNDQLWIDNLEDINYLGYIIEPTTSGFGIKINQSTLLNNDVYIANGMVPPSIHDISPNIFKRGNQYKVYGRFGWKDIPDEVEQATIEIIRSYFSKDRVWKDRYVNKISTTDWDFQYTSDAFTGTGSAYADKLLLDYVVTQMVVV